MPSSVIETMRFDPVASVLEIAFRGARGVYRYFNVPVEEWRRFRHAPSKGAYLNGFFKAKKYPYEKIALVERREEQKTNLLCWPEQNPSAVHDDEANAA